MPLPQPHPPPFLLSNRGLLHHALARPTVRTCAAAPSCSAAACLPAPPHVPANPCSLAGLPLYGLGVSVGGGFVLKLPQHIKFDGIMSEVLGPRPYAWDPWTYQHGESCSAGGSPAWCRCGACDGKKPPQPWSNNPACPPCRAGMPPVVFVSMDGDPYMAWKISQDSQILRNMSVPVATVRVTPRTLHPSFFSDRRWGGRGGVKGGGRRGARLIRGACRGAPVTPVPVAAGTLLHRPVQSDRRWACQQRARLPPPVLQRPHPA